MSSKAQIFLSACVKAKVMKLNEDKEKLKEDMEEIHQYLDNENIAAAKEVAAAHCSEATVQGNEVNEATVPGNETTALSRPLTISEANEDGISNNIREQMLGFARENNISIEFNRSRGKDQPPITLISRYAKSRPDFTMRLAIIIYKEDETEDETVVAVSTEHKMTDGRDNVGQLLAGTDKAMADAMKNHIRNGGGIINSVIAYALLLDFDQKLDENQKCQLFKVSMNLVTALSTVCEGTETISITDGLNRVLHALRARASLRAP